MSLSSKPQSMNYFSPQHLLVLLLLPIGGAATDPREDPPSDGVEELPEQVCANIDESSVAVTMHVNPAAPEWESLGDGIYAHDWLHRFKPYTLNPGTFGVIERETSGNLIGKIYIRPDDESAFLRHGAEVSVRQQLAALSSKNNLVLRKLTATRTANGLSPQGGQSFRRSRRRTSCPPDRSIYPQDCPTFL